MSQKDELVPQLREMFAEQASSVHGGRQDWRGDARPEPAARAAPSPRGFLVISVCAVAIVVLVASVVVMRGDRAGDDLRVVGQPPPANDTTTASVPAGFRPYAVSWPSAALGWAMGTAPCDAGSCSYVARTEDAGATWAALPGPPVTAFEGVPGILGLAFADARNGWAVIAGAGQADLWATHDAGATWARVGGLASGVVSVAATPDRVYAMVHGSGADSADQLLSAGVENGASWSRVADVVFPPGTGVAPQVVTRGRAVWVLGGSRPGTLAFASEDGSTWERRILPCEGPQMPVVSMASEDASQVAVVCTKAPQDPTTPAYLSRDGGRAFERLGDIPGAGAIVYVAAKNASVIHVTSTTVEGNRSIISTFDGGRTWSAFAAQPSRLGWAGLAFVSPSRLVAAPRGGPVIVSDDTGHSWREVAMRP